ncbi:hypothetical protein CK203_078593 [Vitis vinifera]|uniref:Uncharacterized protein n=1 Tax=Vitis vinifera TaxID=29760 RepID=A0A438C3I1_VITVI|nr:hypothetical protein CK203_078593 [Vitis vinifera]
MSSLKLVLIKLEKIASEASGLQLRCILGVLLSGKSLVQVLLRLLSPGEGSFLSYTFQITLFHGLVDVTLLIHIFLSSSLPTLGVSDISLSKATNEVVCHIDSHLKIGFRKNWHPLMSLNRLLIMHLRWLHLIILYQLKVMYLFLRTLETWQEQLRVIVVFWDTGKQFLLTGKIVF